MFGRLKSINVLQQGTEITVTVTFNEDWSTMLIFFTTDTVTDVANKLGRMLFAIREYEGHVWRRESVVMMRNYDERDPNEDSSK